MNKKLAIHLSSLVQNYSIPSEKWANNLFISLIQLFIFWILFYFIFWIFYFYFLNEIKHGWNNCPYEYFWNKVMPMFLSCKIKIKIKKLEISKVKFLTMKEMKAESFSIYTTCIWCTCDNVLASNNPFVIHRMPPHMNSTTFSLK